MSYNGWKADFNEWINMGSYRLAPPHTHTTNTTNTFVNVTTTPPPRARLTSLPTTQPAATEPLSSTAVTEPRYTASVDNETRFRQKLNTLGLGIVEQEQDGNCLFRSISHQLYDTGELPSTGA